jgi:hypothetical protein
MVLDASIRALTSTPSSVTRLSGTGVGIDQGAAADAGVRDAPERDPRPAFSAGPKPEVTQQKRGDVADRPLGGLALR